MDRNANSAGARLRRTFAYPTDESLSQDDPDVMDEEGNTEATWKLPAFRY